jgi:hypothetical protein
MSTTLRVMTMPFFPAGGGASRIGNPLPRMKP